MMALSANQSQPAASNRLPAGFHFYRDQLPDDNWQIFYRAVEQAVGSFQPLLTFPKVLSRQAGDYLRILEYVYNDHPEFFYFDAFECTYQITDYLVFVKFSYSWSREETEKRRREMNRAAAQVLAECFPDGFDHLPELHREKKIFDWISDNVTYDHEAAENVKKHQENPEAWTAYGALVRRKAVCHGIACAFKLLCDRVGMPSIIVLGDAGGRHAWNIVRIADRFYQVDCTWMLKNSIDLSIPYKRYQYLNVPDEIMLANHTPEAGFLPRCKSLRYNPYRIKGLCCTSAEGLYRIAGEQLKKGLERFAVMCINGCPGREELDRLCSRLSRECGKEFIYTWEKNGKYVGFEVRR